MSFYDAIQKLKKVKVPEVFLGRKFWGYRTSGLNGKLKFYFR